jgi:proteic killer suppression protein
LAHKEAFKFLSFCVFVVVKKCAHYGHKEKRRILHVDFILVLCYYKFTLKVNAMVRNLIVTYKNKSLEKICTDFSEAVRKYGTKIAEKIHLRINEISAATSIEMMIQFHIGRCHQLTGNRNGQYSVDLAQPYRLIFTVKDGEVQIAKIIEIVDYH